MEDRHGKYIRLFGTLFFSFISFIAAIVLVLLILRFVFGMLSYIPGLVHIFTLFIIAVPAALFISVFLIYIKRTRLHPSRGARIFSYIIFTAALAAWAWFFAIDLITFFRFLYTSVDRYYSYNMIFLSANVFCIFLTGIVQALSLKKEGDWIERRNAADKAANL